MQDWTEENLLQVIEEGEADRIEFKANLSGSAPDRIREAICAFSNDLPNHGKEKPGLIFIGVNDDRTSVGAPVTDALLMQLADMKTDGNIVPPPSLTVQKRVLRGTEVAVITVQPSDSPPVKYKGAICIRIGPRRGIATMQDERILNEKRLHGDRPFDLLPVPSADISDLSLGHFEHEYLPQAFSPEVLAANKRSLHEQLAATKMIDAADLPTPTVLGILTLGKNPQDFLPGAYVQFLRINGVEFTDEIVDSEEIKGAIPDLLRRLDDKLFAHNRVAVDITAGRLEKRTASYPIEAVQQITRNAIMHRTYEATNAPVRVYWFNDRLEILSPGGAFGTVTAENFGNPRFTDYRNPNLAEVMRTLRYVQRFGLGISMARRLLEEAGHPDLKLDVGSGYVHATIRAQQNRERTS